MYIILLYQRSGLKLNQTYITNVIDFQLILMCSQRWMDGSPVVFQRWDQNQPRFLNNDETCAVMTSDMGE